VHSRATRNPSLLALSPPLALEIQVRMLAALTPVEDVSLWSHGDENGPRCVSFSNEAGPSRRSRVAARDVLRGRPPMVGPMRTVPVERWQHVQAVLVFRTSESDEEVALAAAGETALALTPILEREALLSRNASRERALVSSGERLLTRIGFDLHDGPIQDVLSLGAEVSLLRDQVYPFVDDAHRERAVGRFDDILARVTELDRQLRELSRSLESRSIITRPLGEILHREVDSFAERTGIDTRLEIRGDPESLTSAQRIAVYRAIQESLSNIREHSGASTAEIRLRMRRASIEVRVTDDGHGFEVGRALARAAQRGRLGIVGIGERVRMLGGTFEIDSTPGGPTMLTFALPRVTPDERSAFR